MRQTIGLIFTLFSTATATQVQAHAPDFAPPGYVMEWQDEFLKLDVNRRGLKGYVATAWNQPQNFTGTTGTWSSTFPWGTQYPTPFGADFARSLPQNKQEQWFVEQPYFGENGYSYSTKQNYNPFTVGNGLVRIKARPANAYEQKFTNILPPGVPGANGTQRYKYLSGMLQSHTFKTIQYGYVAARIRENTSKGHWATFWLFRDRDGDPDQEIDIFESLGESTWYSNGSHYPGTPNYFNLVPFDRASRAQWHVYSVLWEPNAVTWFRDGVQTGQITTNIPSIPMYMIFDLSVGTTIWGQPENGSPDSTTVWPGVLDIDWVRVYKKQPAIVK